MLDSKNGALEVPGGYKFRSTLDRKFIVVLFHNGNIGGTVMFLARRRYSRFMLSKSALFTLFVSTLLGYFLGMW